MADNISVTICGDGGCEDSYSVTRTVDGLPYFLSITDTAGQEEYRGLWTANTLKSDAFLLVYDITNPSSLETLDHFMDLIDMEAEQRVEDNQRLRKELGPTAGPGVGTPPPVKIVAGNKCDLKDGRAVTSREGLEYARRHGCGFMETSAREMVNIEETFAHLVRRVVEARRIHLQGPDRPSSRTGQSVHTTALPPTTTEVTKRPRARRLFGIGQGRESPETDTDETQGCLFRRLCCVCCG
ncbi:uncharacterized protein N7484_007678 [Penicillium longicatenatum]|uniref:uncharacterized protein n=1 Tax=Penicillium longicatenatum TaxID=1561947 RepID=UPI0025472668|nr:uncharacterized protein N7484_007678 [Penicillium longicatenatum]KAJ5639816.1 hypothetical protein N7484_007678 [Penicillium longicatenatum]